ncbi:MAG: hypothetical protein IT162_14600 [Bryobacterales bacterium]|nr:hypothetical protein [Bryobacterales bacterium]
MKRYISLALIAVAITLPVHASTVVNGGTLLSGSSADQLASWLGEGDLILTNVYSGAATAAIQSRLARRG